MAVNSFVTLASRKLVSASIFSCDASLRTPYPFSNNTRPSFFTTAASPGAPGCVTAERIASMAWLAASSEASLVSRVTATTINIRSTAQVLCISPFGDIAAYHCARVPTLAGIGRAAGGFLFYELAVVNGVFHVERFLFFVIFPVPLGNRLLGFCQTF